VSFVELPVVEFNDIWHDDQLKKSRESIGTKVAPEGLHDPNELGHFQERRRRKLMDLHRKSIQNHGENRITGKSHPAGEEVAKHNYFSIFRSRSLLIQWSTPGARREESSCFIISDPVRGNLGFPEDERRRKRSRRPCSDQIFDVGIYISDVFIVRSDLPIFVTPRLASSRRWVPI
jgi:hypothetical protein